MPVPIETNIDAETGLRTHVLIGEVSLEELEDALGEVYGRPDFLPDADTLCDLREADLGQFSRTVVKGVVDYVAKHRGAKPGARTAVVVGRDLDFGLARMYEQMLVASTDVEVVVFRDIEEARTWLRSGGEE